MSEFVAGWVGGCCGLFVGHPLDTLKVRQQALNTSSISQTFRNCIKQDGVRSLMKGLSYPIYSVGAVNSLLFGAYVKSLEMIRSTNSSFPPSYTEILLAGGISGAVQLSIACPVDLIKVRLQSVKGRMGPFDCLKEIYREGGVRGCYKGLVPQFFRDVKANAVYFISYQACLDWIKGTESRENTASEIFLAGGIAGLLSWQVIIYLDVLKSRIQADSLTNPQYKGMWDCAVKSYRQDGVKVFSRGFVLMSIRAFPVNGATFLGYEYSMKLFNHINKK